MNEDQNIDQVKFDALSDKEIFTVKDLLVKIYDTSESRKKGKFRPFEKKVEKKNDYYLSYLRQIRGLRLVSFILISTMMVVETIILYTLLILTSLHKIDIDEIALRILVGATISQVGTMMIFIIKSVFPPKLDDIITGSDD